MIGKTDVFIQWKGTDACFDLRCECDTLSHFDTDYAYYIRCPKCRVVYKMPWTLEPVKARIGEYNEEQVKDAVYS